LVFGSSFASRSCSPAWLPKYGMAARAGDRCRRGRGVL